jgi:hypothetical protein
LKYYRARKYPVTEEVRVPLVEIQKVLMQLVQVVEIQKLRVPLFRVVLVMRHGLAN